MEDEGIDISERTVGKILKAEWLVKKYLVGKIKYKYIKTELSPGEIVEIGVKYILGTVENKRYYQFTATDVASRWRRLEIYDEQANFHSVEFLKKTISLASFKIKAVKTDNHSTFTNRYTGYLKSSDPFNPKLHPLDVFCAENGTVERSHGSDQQRLYGKETFSTVDCLKYRVRLWNMYYNDLRHCGLKGKSPINF